MFQIISWLIPVIFIVVLWYATKESRVITKAIVFLFYSGFFIRFPLHKYYPLDGQELIKLSQKTLVPILFLILIILVFVFFKQITDLYKEHGNIAGAFFISIGIILSVISLGTGIPILLNGILDSSLSTQHRVEILEISSNNIYIGEGETVKYAITTSWREGRKHEYIRVNWKPNQRMTRKIFQSESERVWLLVTTKQGSLGYERVVDYRIEYEDEYRED